MKRLLWFRRDLRTQDNPLLAFDGEVLPIFIFDTGILDKLASDDRRVGIIHTMVSNLRAELRSLGLDLFIFHGKPAKIIAALQQRFGFDEVCASVDFDAYGIERDRQVSHLLPFHTLYDTYITRPDEILKNDGTPFLIFSPFYKALKVRFTSKHMREYTIAVSSLLPMEPSPVPSLDTLGFTPSAYKLESPTELLARLTPKLANYKEQRDRLDIDGTSHLDVALRFGTISFREILRWLAERKKEGIDTEPFFRQLVFRDFYAHMLYHFPYLAHKNYRYTWGGIADETKHRAFCEARTGFPVVDAGIRELLQTGEMHNRVRMICASFYTKDLLLPWQWGERFFAAHLNDYDAASNILSWQWSAGTGIDPQPYFRIFNPWLQSKKFDPDARYIKRWLPELGKINPGVLHDEAKMAELTLNDYPRPMLYHKQATDKALAYFKSKYAETLA